VNPFEVRVFHRTFTHFITRQRDGFANPFGRFVLPAERTTNTRQIVGENLVMREPLVSLEQNGMSVSVPIQFNEGAALVDPTLRLVRHQLGDLDGDGEGLIPAPGIRRQCPPNLQHRRMIAQFGANGFNLPRRVLVCPKIQPSLRGGKVV